MGWKGSNFPQVWNFIGELDNKVFSKISLIVQLEGVRFSSMSWIFFLRGLDRRILYVKWKLGDYCAVSYLPPPFAVSIVGRPYRSFYNPLVPARLPGLLADSAFLYHKNVVPCDALSFYDVPYYCRFWRLAISRSLAYSSQHIETSLLLCPIKLFPQSEHVTLYVPLDSCFNLWSLGDPSLVWIWCILLDDIMPIFNYFIVFKVGRTRWVCNLYPSTYFHVCCVYVRVSYKCQKDSLFLSNNS